jgi:uncharacterized cofD-like protein
MSGPTRTDPSIVALGGGHGLYATLTAVRTLSPNITAVVTVADDGGSSGRLRRELGVIPPGDLRMALSALAGTDPHAQLWRATVQHRFRGDGPLAGHSVGNLILAGLTEVIGDPVVALEELARILNLSGRVLPMSTIPLAIEADVSGLESDPRVSRVVRGQVAVAVTPGKVRRVRLVPADPPACPEALDAIEAADLVVLGPGSWFSSVIPHVLVPEVRNALARTRARKVLVLNLGAEPGETAGFSAERHLHVLSQHAPELAVDHIVVDAPSVEGDREREHLRRAAANFGAVVSFADVAESGALRHDPDKLAAAIESLRTARTATPAPMQMDDGDDRAGSNAGPGRKESTSWR